MLDPTELDPCKEPITIHSSGSSNPVPCDNKEGRNRVGGRRVVPEGGDICILMADSCCCMAETNTTL